MHDKCGDRFALSGPFWTQTLFPRPEG